MARQVLELLDEEKALSRPLACCVILSERLSFPSAQASLRPVGGSSAQEAVSRLASVCGVECSGGGRDAFCTWQIKVEPGQAAWSWRLPCPNPAVTSEGLLYSTPHVNMGTLVPATFQTVCSLNRGWENTRPH